MQHLTQFAKKVPHGYEVEISNGTVDPVWMNELALL